MLLTIAGRGASYAWHSLPNHVDNIRIDEFVVMPDHVHGIIRIVESGPLLGHVVRSFKAAATSEIRARCPMIGKVWQRNYYERIIRNEYALLAIRRYIVNNPSAWIARRGNDPDA